MALDTLGDSCRKQKCNGTEPCGFNWLEGYRGDSRMELFPFSLLRRIEGRKQGNGLIKAIESGVTQVGERALGCCTQAPPPRSAVCPKNQLCVCRAR